MARSRAKPPALRFRGPPSALHAFAPGELGVEAPDVRASLDLAGPPSIAPLALEATHLPSGAAHVRLELPPTTPPGTYEGSLRTADGVLAVAAEVESYPSLRLAPAQLLVEAVPGEAVEAHVTALNDGNVPLELPDATAFGLFDVAGAERGVRAAFASPEGGEARLGALADELAAAHGGLVRVQIAEGAGMLAPGEVRALLLRLRLSDGLERGRTYSGTLSLHTLRYYVRVTVGAGESRPRRRKTA